MFLTRKKKRDVTGTGRLLCRNFLHYTITAQLNIVKCAFGYLLWFFKQLNALSQSDMGEALGQSTDSRGSVIAPQALVPVKSQGQAPVEYPDQDKKVTIVNGQMVIRSTQPSGDEGIVIRPTTAGRGRDPGTGEVKHDSPPPGSTAPRSSPTHSSMQEQIKFQQNEALKR